MAGIHGKNAQLKLSTSEETKTDVVLTLHTDPTLAAAGVYKSTDQDWKYAAVGEDGSPVVTYESPSGTVKTIDANANLIHYAGGAVKIPDEDIAALLAGSVKATYVAVELETVGNILGQDRSAELNIEADVVDTTTLNENFRTFVEGIQGFSGSLDGLYLNPGRIKLAMASIGSGVIPRKVLRFRPRPDKDDTYFQANVIFPTYNFSLAYDSAVERTIEFTGVGPLELMEDGVPYFPGISPLTFV